MDLIWSFLSVLLPFLFVLTVVVFIHELGHFIVARWCGVKVQAFSIGFGREIWGFNDRHGTRWRLAWIPLGGYVKFVDDENGASVPSRDSLARMSQEERQGAFQTKSLGRRAAIVAAGPIANFLLAIAIFAGIFATVGVQITSAKIDEVIADGPAARAGFQAGDVIVAIDGSPIKSFQEMQRVVSTSADQPLNFEINRGGLRMNLTATPDRREHEDRFGNKIRVGVIGIRRTMQPQDLEYQRHGVLDSLVLGVRETQFVISRTLGYLRDVVLGREAADQLGGPIRIAEVSGQVASSGFVPLLNLTAILSVSIGLLNLFPIPLLDGGHLMFYLMEAIRRKPLSERTQEIGFRIGLSLVLMLMIYATFNDLPIVRKWIGLG
ncbi:MAG TPA: RIP metalloprotease RseP [Hyphomicrobiaceae bacterium]|nr:RIP metalloprotease RseP [Hyphomicrobiaceae bacterium]